MNRAGEEFYDSVLPIIDCRLSRTSSAGMVQLDLNLLRIDENYIFF